MSNARVTLCHFLTSNKRRHLFGLFRKKTQIEKLILDDGIEHATDRFAQIVARKLPTRYLAYQFILEELDGASKGNAASQQFAKNSGIPSTEYLGTLANSTPEVDGPEGPQQLLLGFSLQISDRELMTEFRCKIDDKIMRHFELGNYAKKEEEPLHVEEHSSDPATLGGSVLPKNYDIKPNGFTVEDAESGDGLAAVIRDEMFHGAVLIGDIGAHSSLAPWTLNENPFEDDNHFFGTGMSPQGQWSFSIRPSVPFSQILRETREQYVRSRAQHQ